MISFDDLVDTGINTDEIENDLRNIRLNTQINRFSIIDCTNSIESLSSNTLALYNSISTITGGGGGGFGYLEPFSAHSTESFIYNCNDVLSNQSFNETFKEVGPNINFDNVSFTTNQKLNLKGQTLNSCLIQSNTEPMMLDYKLIQNNNLYNNSLINIKADEFKNNIITNSSTSILFPHYNITALTDSGNQYSEISYLYMSNNNISDNTFISVKRNYITANIISSNMFSRHCYGNMIASSFIYNTMSYNCINNVLLMEHIHSNLFSYNIGLYLDAGNAKKNTYIDNNYLKGCIRYCSGNSYDSINMLSLTGTSHSLNNFNKITSMNLVNVYFKQNLLNNNSFINLSGYSLKSNTITTNSFININGYYVEYNKLDQNSLINIDGYSLSGNSAYGQFLLNTVNGYIMYKNQISGRVGKICHDQGSGNTFQPSILDYTGFSVSSNTIGGYQHGHVRIGFAEGNYIGSVDDGGLLTLEVFSAKKINVSSVRGFCDIKAGNLYTCTIYYDTVCNISAKNISSCAINNNPICNIDVWSSYIYNTLSSCKYAKINGLTNINFDRNTFNDIETLKICIDNTKQFINKISNISELHLKNANMFNSTKSITFDNISSYYFKYTDGLYSGTDIISDLTSISNSAFIKYVPCSWLNQTFTSSGSGGGFNYWQSYDEHPIKGYNVSERLESDIMNNNIQGVGPAADFYDCTFQDKYVNLTGNEFNSNHIFNNTWYHNLDYLTFNNNNYEIINSLKINCDICSANTFNQVKYLDLACIRPMGINSFTNCTDLYIKNQGEHQLILTSCKNVNLTGGNIYGVAMKNDYVKMNVNEIKSFNYSNNFNELTCYNCFSNTFKDCELFNLNAYSMSNNTFNGIGDYKIKCHNCNGLTAEVRQFNIEGYNIKNCLLSSYNEGDVSSLWSHDVYLKAFYAESIRAFRISNLHIDVSAYLLHANISNIGTLYLNYTIPFISEQKASSDTDLMNNVYIYSCSHFDFPAIGRVVNNGVYSWGNIPSQYVYINGVQLSKLM